MTRRILIGALAILAVDYWWQGEQLDAAREHTRLAVQAWGHASLALEQRQDSLLIEACERLIDPADALPGDRCTGLDGWCVRP